MHLNGNGELVMISLCRAQNEYYIMFMHFNHRSYVSFNVVRRCTKDHNSNDVV